MVIMDINISFIPFIEQIVGTIVSTVAPDKIILFGSYARGDNKKNSDIDILILKKGLKNERSVTKRLYMDFFTQRIPVPVDLIAMDYEKFDALSSDIGYIYKTIKQEGIVIYE